MVKMIVRDAPARPPQKVRRVLTRNDYAKRGLVFLVGLGVVIGLVFLRSAGSFGGPEHVEAQLVDAGGSLLDGADVKVRGVIVGRVTGIGASPEGHGVRVKMDLPKDKLDQVPANVQARILPATVFGTSFVDLVTHEAPASTPLKAGAVIPADRTQGTLEVQQALDDIDRLVKAVGPAELASAIGSAAQALTGRGVKLGQTIDVANGYLAKLNPKMPLLRSDLQKLAANLQLLDGVAPDLLAATNDALVFARTIVTQKAAIATLLAGGTSLATQANAFLDANARGLVTVLHNSSALLDVVYANRHAGITEAIAVNRIVNTGLASIMKHGFVDMQGPIQMSVPGYYTASQCPRFGPARGDNCGGAARAGVSALIEGGSR